MEEKVIPLETPKKPPRQVHPAVVFFSMWLGIISLFVDPWLAWPLRVLTVSLGTAYFVQHFRKASWTVDQAARVTEVREA